MMEFIDYYIARVNMVINKSLTNDTSQTRARKASRLIVDDAMPMFRAS